VELIDMFLAKYDQWGNFVWAKTAGSTTNEVGYAVALDNSGNIFVTGRFGRTATFDSTTITSAGDEEIFTAKYNASGTLVWVKRAGGSGYDFADQIVVDESGNAYITGGCRQTSTFGSLSFTAAASSDIFLTKYDPNGTALWVRHWGNSSGNYNEGYGLVRDTNGNFYLTGEFQGTLTLGSTTLTNAGRQDVFVMKVDPSGTPIWAARAGGTNLDRGLDLAVDKSGNVFVTGYFAGPGSFGGTNFPGNDSNDIFLAKYDPAGNLSWVKFGRSTGTDQGYHVKTDSAGNVYLTGYFSGVAAFDSYDQTSTGAQDGFLAKYDFSGNLLSFNQISSTNSEWGRAMVINATDSVFWTGAFGGKINFGSKTITNTGSLSVFLTRYDEVPELRISRGPNQIIASWATNFVGFILQTSTNVSAPENWLNDSNVPALVNGRFEVTNALSESSKFYRLKK
jgi:hypothetical protein